ncbi:AraC family transcriptional regulator [Paraflavitalea soli]|uniref:AraC family transcriptional regulator n=1 Tax=Paraflavitalea soli TaxID=2315862 RepID=A0A3B7MLW2_9BACT|nr:helix-turn-helix domain-containing protein [Paraflavitalea soli]AXY72595.1 AraC family transcriptional regulator [Paraflavitalea soli]
MVEIFDNIRKLYQFSAPCPALAAYIEFYSETSPEAMRHHVGEAPFTVKMFPSFTPTIWLNLGTPYQLRNGQQLHLVDEHTDILLLRSDIVERRNLPTDNIFTVKFNPGGFEAVFGIAQTRIGHDVVNVNEIIPATILRKLKRLNNFDSRLSFLEQFLLDKLAATKAQVHYLQSVQQVIQTFCASGMQLNNQELANRQHLTEKTMYRYFMQAIGTNPKNFFATLRARTALTDYISHKDGFDHLMYGYYDLSHFYKDVVKFTGRRLSTQE